MATKKKWTAVEVPLMKRSYEVLANTPEELIGKTIKLDLTRKLGGKSVELVLEITAQDNKLVAIPKKLTILSYYTRRVVKRGTSYVEDSFPAETKDAVVRVKPLLVTRRRVSRAIKKHLRDVAREWLLEKLKNTTIDKLFEELLAGKLQKELSLTLKKIYPLSFCDIRMLVVKARK